MPNCVVRMSPSPWCGLPRARCRFVSNASNVTVSERRPSSRCAARAARSATRGRPIPATDDLRVFIATGEQGVNYARGTWHHPLLVVDEAAEFLVIDRVTDDGRDDNCEVLKLTADAIWIEPLE